VAYFSEIGPYMEIGKPRQTNYVDTWHRYLVGFFDGASQNFSCNCGAFIVVKPGSFFISYGMV